MLGIPYEGRMPAFGAGAGNWGVPSGPPAPEVVAQRALRSEQDAAYQASLAVRVSIYQMSNSGFERSRGAHAFSSSAATRPMLSCVQHMCKRSVLRCLEDERKGLGGWPQADMEKAQIAARAAAVKEEAEAAVRAQEAAAANAEQAYERDIAAKRARLPAEPPADAGEAITVLVRLPNGRRASRRRVLAAQQSASSNRLEPFCAGAFPRLPMVAHKIMGCLRSIHGTCVLPQTARQSAHARRHHFSNSAK